MATSRPTQNTGKGRQRTPVRRGGAPLDGDALSEALLYGDRGTRQTAVASESAKEATIERLVSEHQGSNERLIEQLKTRIPLMDKMFQHIPIMITILDAKARAIYVNKECERVSGWTEQEVREHPDIFAACYPDPGERKEALEFIRCAEARWRAFRTTNKCGVRVPCMWMSLRVGDVLFLVGIDITEQKRREADAQRTREDVEARVERRIPSADPYGLTFRELTVLTLVAEGKTDREIAGLLSIGCRTVQTHISNVLTKMGATHGSRGEGRAGRHYRISVNRAGCNKPSGDLASVVLRIPNAQSRVYR